MNQPDVFFTELGQEDIVIYEVRPHTELWLKKMGVPYGTLRMRQEGDHCPDSELKGRWLEVAREAGDMPDLVFDDRTKSVGWWRSQGITCCQVADHDY